MTGSIAVRLKKVIPRFITADAFLRKSAVLAGGTACGQAITVLTVPILTRLYSTSDFGHLQAFLSVFTLISVISSLRYETAILLPEEGLSAACLAELACAVAVGASMITALGFFVWGAVMGSGGLLANGALWILPISILGGGWNQVATHWCIRQGDYTKIAKMKITQGAAQVLTQIALGIAQIGGAGLLLGHLAGRTAGTVNILRSAWRAHPGMFRTAANWSRMCGQAARYKSFPLVAGPATLVNTAALSITPLLVGSCFGAEVLGLYGLVERSLNVSAILIGQSMSQVYMTSAARLAATDPDALAELFLRTLKRLALLAVLPCLLIMLAGPPLFPLVFGPAWRGAGAFARIMAPSAYVAFVVWPLMPTLVILERQSMQLQWDVARLLLVVGTFTIVHRLGGDARSAIAANAVAFSVMYVVHAVLSYRSILRRKAEMGIAVQEQGVLV